MNELILNRRSEGLFAAGQQSLRTPNGVGARPDAAEARAEDADAPARGPSPLPVVYGMRTRPPIKITN
jgi:hypothetical protein